MKIRSTLAGASPGSSGSTRRVSMLVASGARRRAGVGGREGGFRVGAPRAGGGAGGGGGGAPAGGGGGAGGRGGRRPPPGGGRPPPPLAGGAGAREERRQLVERQAERVPAVA